MRLDILRGTVAFFKLFAKSCHKNPKGGNIAVPAASPNAPGYEGMG